jgi:hypothetical protein
VFVSDFRGFPRREGSRDKGPPGSVTRSETRARANPEESISNLGSLWFSGFKRSREIFRKQLVLNEPLIDLTKGSWRASIESISAPSSLCYESGR